MNQARESSASTTGRCFLIGAGDFGDGCPAPEPSDLVIAGDGGLAACRLRGIRADRIIGDFDSLGFVPESEGVIRLPVEKDDTDMRAAMRLGWELGYRDFVIYGGTGGRISHTFANIALMKEIVLLGGSAQMIGEGTRYTVIRDSFYVISADRREDVSVFALGETAEGVTIRGLKYEIQNARLRSEYPLGVSNHTRGEKGEIRVVDGILLIVEETSAGGL